MPGACKLDLAWTVWEGICAKFSEALCRPRASRITAAVVMSGHSRIAVSRSSPLLYANGFGNRQKIPYMIPFRQDHCVPRIGVCVDHGYDQGRRTLENKPGLLRQGPAVSNVLPARTEPVLGMLSGNVNAAAVKDSGCVVHERSVVQPYLISTIALGFLCQSFHYYPSTKVVLVWHSASLSQASLFQCLNFYHVVPCRQSPSRNSSTLSFYLFYFFNL